MNLRRIVLAAVVLTTALSSMNTGSAYAGDSSMPTINGPQLIDDNTTESVIPANGEPARPRGGYPTCFYGAPMFSEPRDINNFPSYPAMPNRVQIEGLEGYILDEMRQRVAQAFSYYRPGDTRNLNTASAMWSSADPQDRGAPDLVLAALGIRASNGGWIWDATVRDSGRLGWLESGSYSWNRGPSGTLSGVAVGPSAGFQEIVPVLSPADATSTTIGPFDLTDETQERREDGGYDTVLRLPSYGSQLLSRMWNSRVGEQISPQNAIARWNSLLSPTDSSFLNAKYVPQQMKQVARSSWASSYRLPIIIQVKSPGGWWRTINASEGRWGTFPQGSQWRGIVYIPNRPRLARSLSEAQSALSQVINDMLKVQWNTAYRPGMKKGVYYLPVFAGPKCDIAPIRIGGVTIDRRTNSQPCDKLGRSSTAAYFRNNIGNDAGNCYIFWRPFDLPPPRMTSQSFRRVLTDYIHSNRVTPSVGTAVVNVPFNLNVASLSSLARTATIQDQYGQIRLALQQPGMSLQIGDGSLWRLDLARAASGPNAGYGTIQVVIPRTPASVLQDDKCQGLSTANLELICGIVFVPDASGRSVPAFKVTVRTWYSGIYEFTTNPGRLRGLFHPRYTDMRGVAGIANYWAPWRSPTPAGWITRAYPNAAWGWPASGANPIARYGCWTPLGDNGYDERSGCGQMSWLSLNETQQRGLPSRGTPMWDAGGNGQRDAAGRAVQPGNHFILFVDQVQAGPGN